MSDGGVDQVICGSCGTDVGSVEGLIDHAKEVHGVKGI